MQARTALAILALILLSAAVAGWLAPYHPAAQHRDHALEPPGAAFPLGTDEFGRDLLSRFLHGGRASLAAGLLAVALTLTAGLAAGCVAGYGGGWVDEAVMRVADLFQALPWLYLLLAARALLPLSVSPAAGLLLVAGLIGLAGWPRPARLVRGVVASARGREYVRSARSFGATPWYLLRRHILPDVYPLLGVQAALLLPRYLAAEVTLSFLGLGIGEPFPSWGGLLAALRQTALVRTCWWLALPALALIPLFAALFAIADRLSRGNAARLN